MIALSHDTFVAFGVPYYTSASPRIQACDTRPFPLRGLGLGTRLGQLLQALKVHESSSILHCSNRFLPTRGCNSHVGERREFVKRSHRKYVLLRIKLISVRTKRYYLINHYKCSSKSSYITSLYRHYIKGMHK